MTTYPTVEVVRRTSTSVTSGDATVYEVYDRNSDLSLGAIRWSFKCKRYTFFPNEGITLTAESMEDIVHEMNHANEGHRRSLTE